MMQLTRRRSEYAGGAALAAILACLVMFVSSDVAADELASKGKLLFEKRWTPGDSQSPSGDGLGPLHNDLSCVACHSQGGVGGGGPLKNNVDVLAIVPPNERVNSANFSARVGRIHPGFTASGSLRAHIILHRFGTNGNYASLRRRLLGEKSDFLRTVPEQHAREISFSPTREIEIDGVQFMHVQRNSTAMFGAGLIDAIPDEVIRKEAVLQSRDKWVSGRPAPTLSGGVGRFGWRGQTEHLKDFVLGACAAELGLQTGSNSQAVDPFNPKRDARQVADLKAEQVDAMVAFISQLPKPRELTPGEAAAETVRRGRRLFTSTGCASCHKQQLGDVVGLYSDLLLHDMGQTLGDLAAAELPQEMVTKLTAISAEGARASNAYYGIQRDPVAVKRAMQANAVLRQVVSASFREYRTPPLWGLRDSAPYMHDGRAKSITEAIALHGGEGLYSSTNFFELPIDQRRAMLDFLQTLAAPEPAKAVAAR